MDDQKKQLEYVLDNAKEENDFKIAEIKESYDRDKDKLKNKASDLENKIREGESRRTALIFEHEKERTKWNLEKEHLINQKNDVLESLDKIQNKKESLLRENERLRNENKKNRRLAGFNPGYQGGLYGEATRYGGGTYLNTSKYAERSFRKDADIRIQTESNKGDKENDFTGAKFNLLDMDNSESKQSKSPMNELAYANTNSVLTELNTNLDTKIDVIEELE